MHQNKYQLHIAEADTHISAWSFDAVVGISQKAALANISYVIAEHLIAAATAYITELHTRHFCINRRYQKFPDMRWAFQKWKPAESGYLYLEIAYAKGSDPIFARCSSG